VPSSHLPAGNTTTGYRAIDGDHRHIFAIHLNNIWTSVVHATSEAMEFSPDGKS
jgi:hypothetical protein